MYSDDYLKSIVDKFENENVPDEELVELITKIADSGEKIPSTGNVFDYASTGGPSSLSTLLVPLFLFSRGVNVINLAVPGRPAGAVDVLAQIPNYNLSDNPLRHVSEKEHFYIHLEANEKYVPLDRALFTYRQKNDKVDITNLVIASILSKKVATGAENIGLDVRMSRFGNFGKTWAESCRNSEKYNRIAALLKLNSTCFISDANKPYQKYIGRGESLLALNDIFSGIADDELMEHVSYCKFMADEMIKKTNVANEAKKEMDIKTCFNNNLSLQGSSMNEFEAVVERIGRKTRVEIISDKSGYIQYDLYRIKNIIKEQQIKYAYEALYPDPCGVILMSKSGYYIEKGQAVLSVRSKDLEAIELLKESFSVVTKPIVETKRCEVI